MYYLLDYLGRPLLADPDIYTIENGEIKHMQKI